MPQKDPAIQIPPLAIATGSQEHVGQTPADQLVDLLQGARDAQKDLDLLDRSFGRSLNKALSHGQPQDLASLSLCARIKLLNSKVPLTWEFDESIAGDSGQATTSLCEICRTINFTWLLHNKTRLFEGPCLGNLDAVAGREDCAFCRLVTRFFEQAYLLETRDASADHETWECYLSGVQDVDGEFFVVMVDHEKIRFRFGVRQLGESLGDARLVPEVLDFGLIKSWLNQSEMYDLSTAWIQHTEGKMTAVPRDMGSAKMIRLASEFRLIDVKKGCVVRSTINARYIALSYVWGGIPLIQLQKHNRKELEVEGSLNAMSHLLGQTTIDAMVAVKRLGETYLWVDSLCIIQDDPVAKGTQLASMDEIYRSSAMTIVAFSAESSNAKLPGVRKGSRNPVQIVETVGEIHLVTGLNRFHLFFDRCKWNSRAWTYQEQLLSSRLLFMAPEQVFLKTRTLNFQEDTLGLTKQHRRDNISMTVTKNWASCIGVNSQVLHERQHSIPTTKAVNFYTYMDVVENYKKRGLSYPKMDFWNAFSGIVSELETIFRGPILEGLPQTEIEEALLWHWDSDSIQIQDNDDTFLSPSYSWLGWTGQVRYHRQPLNISCIKWFVDELQDDSFNSDLCVMEAFRQNPNGKARLQWKHVNAKYRYYYRVDQPDLHFLHPIDPEDERPVPIHSQVVEGNVLRFRAQTAFLHLSKKHRTSTIFHGNNIMPTINACKDGVHKVCPLSILDKDGCLAGTVEVPFSVSAELPEGKYEFLALSRPFDYDSPGGPRLPDSVVPIFPNGAPSGDTDPYLWPPEIFQNMSSEPSQETKGTNNASASQNVDESFDTQKYPQKFFCEYTVLLILWNQPSRGGNSTARRVGIGRIHIDAFAQASPEEKTIHLR